MLVSKAHTPGRSKVKMMMTSMNSPRETPSRSRFGVPIKPALGAEAPTALSQVRVVARVRPFLQSEMAACHESSRPHGSHPHTEIYGAPAVCCEIIRSTDGNDIFQIFDSNAKSSRCEAYKLDACYGEKDGNTAHIFAAEMNHVIRKVMDGQNATVFAHGAYGSGKTYTMKGTDNQPGLIPLAVESILLEADQSHKKVEISFYHVYMDRSYDLLQPKMTEFFVLEDSLGRTQLKGLTKVHVKTTTEFLSLFTEGCARRRIGATDISSCSHAVLSVMVTNGDETNQHEFLTGKLNLVDLAGLETGVRLPEIAAAVKQSLFVLSNVIVALTANEARVPYRESKLTRILQDSLGGNKLATIIACLSPGSFQEASATLGVAARSRQVHSRQLSNEDQEMDFGEKLDLESKLRSWRDSRAKTPGKIAPSPLHPYTPGHPRSCPQSPSVKSAKRTLAADLDISLSRVRDVEIAGPKICTVKDISEESMNKHEYEENPRKTSKALDFDQKTPMDIEDKISAISEKPYLECSGSSVLPDENFFQSILTQYDNPIYQEDSPPLSARLKCLETNMRALSPLSANVQPLQSKPGVSPVNFNIGYVMDVDISLTCANTVCPSHVQAMVLPERGFGCASPQIGTAQAYATISGSSTPFQEFKQNNSNQAYATISGSLTPCQEFKQNNSNQAYATISGSLTPFQEFKQNSSNQAYATISGSLTPFQEFKQNNSNQAYATISGSLTPFQEFKQNNSNLQTTLLKQYLTVLNTASKEELLQLKGIGPRRADNILDLRERSLEPFKELDDLKSIGLSERQAHAIFNSNIAQKVMFPLT